MTTNNLIRNRGLHLRRRFGFAFGGETTGNLIEISSGETPGGAKKNAVGGLFDDEFRTWTPGMGRSYVLG
jgi:hypothetical protein